MWWASIAIGFLIAMSLTASDPQPVAAEAVAQAIANFERPWLPDPGSLAGLRMAVAAGETASSHDRTAHALTTLTCGYVEQFAKRAGADIVPASDDVPRRDVAITVRFMEGADNEVAANEGGHSSTTAILTECLRLAIAVDPTATEHRSSAPASDGTHEPAACRIAFGFDPTQTATHELLCKTARDRAAAIVRGTADFNSRTRVNPLPPRDEETTKLHGIVRTIWPEGNLPPDRADWFCRMFARLAITNPSLVYFKPEAAVEGDTIVLRGATNVPALVTGLKAALRSLGCTQVRSEVRELPDLPRLGGERFGACVVSSVITRGEPNEATVEQTELFYGEPVLLLDRVEGYYLLHAGDGYWGWAPQAAIRTLSEPEFRAYSAHERAVVLEDIDAGPVRVPRSALVAIEPAPQPGKLALILPDGNRADVDAQALRPLGAQQGAAAADRVRAALDLLYTPYKFGGRSPLGLDCSGLVNAVCARSGHTPARDASQLVVSGALIATRWDRAGLRAGDIVYFIDPRGKVYHAGIALDPTHILDACPPAVQIGSLLPGDRLYDPRMDRDFFMAKRP